jgi:hypothetical protein
MVKRLCENSRTPLRCQDSLGIRALSRHSLMRPIIRTTMATKVNYDDNLFFLISLTKVLGNGLKLELDADYFKDKVLEDILFIDRTLHQIYEALSVNAYLINRKGHLRELMRAKRSFADLLDEVINGKSRFSHELSPFESKLSSARAQHISDISDIQDSVEPGQSAEQSGDVVSQDEFRFLFSDEENSGESDE